MYILLSDGSTNIFQPTVTRSVAFGAYQLPDDGNGGGGSQLQRWSSLIGIVTAIIGNILISFALNIQRYAHIKIEQEWEERKEKSRNSSRTQLQKGYGTTAINGNGNGHGRVSNGDAQENGDNRDEALEEDPLTRSFESADSHMIECPDEDHIERETYLHSLYWWAGIVLMTVGETGNFLAYGFAPASIVSPLGVVALISNCVIAPIMLKERFRWRDFWGVAVAVCGAVTVVLSAKQQEKKLGPHEVIDAITTMEFEIYMAVTCVIIALLTWASPRYGNKTILIDLGLVGLFGGYTALSTKGIASMLSSALWQAFTTPITYALIAVLIGTAVMQVKYVNKALQRFDSTQVIPVQFVLFTLSVIIGSAVLYRDFESTSPERAVKFIGGCLLTFFGVFLITSGRSRGDDQYDDEGYEDVEERIEVGDEESSGVSRLYHDESHKHYRPQGYITDGAFDSPNASRRSSRVSFAHDPSRPTSPRIQSSTSKPPSILLTPSINASHNSAESGPLQSNPWKDSHDSMLAAARHPGIPATSSTSVLPSDAMQSSSEESVLRRSVSHANPRTHPSQQHVNGPPAADSQRPVTPARHSLRNSMIPGPFISPLSSSLSAVIAETLRRGVESPLRNKRSFHRPRILRRSQSGRNQDQQVGDEEEYGPALSKTVSAGPYRRTEEEAKRSRSRSLSNALGLGEFWKSSSSKRQKRDEEDDEDEGEGPSGQGRV